VQREAGEPVEDADAGRREQDAVRCDAPSFAVQPLLRSVAGEGAADMGPVHGRSRAGLAERNAPFGERRLPSSPLRSPELS
jgi:hypothetical protein